MLSSHRCQKAKPRPAARRIPVVPILVLAFLAPFAGRAAHAAGSFPLSSCQSCDQRGSGAVAGNPQGGFLTSWTGSAATAPQAVAARFFKPDGLPRGADVVLSATAPFANGDTAVAADGTGFFAAAWSRKDGLNSEIFLQRFKRTSAPFGAPIQVSLDDPGAVKLDFAPALAFLPDGSLLVVWERYGPAFGTSPSTPVEVLSRRVSFRNGRPFGPAQKVSDGLVDAGRVALCANRTGAIAAAWTSLDAIVPFQPSLRGAAFRRLTPSGQPFGATVALVAPTASIGGVALSCSASSFTAVWRSNTAPADGPGIVARRIATNGTLGSAFAVSDAGNVRVSVPAAFEDANANTVAAWLADDGAATHVVFRKIAAAGGLGAETAVTALAHTSANLLAPAVSGLGRAGDFVLVWSVSDGLFGRRFAASGSPLASRALAADLDVLGADEP